MDERSLHALELPGVLACLAGFALSEAGSRACLALRPYSSYEDIARQSALFEQGRLWMEHSGARLEPFADIEGLLRAICVPGTVPDADDLFILRQVLLQGRELAKSMDDPPGGAVVWPLWEDISQSLAIPNMSIAALCRCLSDEGTLRDEASPELALARGELRRLYQSCSRKVGQYVLEYNIAHYLQDSFVTISSDRYVLPLKANFKGRLQGVVHEDSQTGETCYFEPMFLVELNNRLQELKREERRAMRAVLLAIGDQIRAEHEGITALYAFLVELDLLFARAALGTCYDGRMLEFSPAGGIRLIEARHPLLALHASQAAARALKRRADDQSGVQCASAGAAPEPDAPAPGEKTQPDDASRGGDALPSGEEGEFFARGVYSYGIRPERKTRPDDASRQSTAAAAAAVVPSTLELLPGQRALVISGGNAGGKTVCLKTVGLTALMGMCALPVPLAAHSSLPHLSGVHAFIGDEQSLADNLSTFTAQIRHLGRIWPSLGPDSLVILDEFGAGTDPAQGAALAQAVINQLMERGAFVAAATHFPGLKAYALSAQGVRAASVLFDPGTKKPLFRLAYDQVGASQALDVARSHGLPETVLRAAHEYLLSGGEDSAALIDRLNTLAHEREVEIALLGKERAAFVEKRRALQERFDKERAAVCAEIQAEARRLIAEHRAARLGRKQTLKELSSLRASALAGAAPDRTDAGELFWGDASALFPGAGEQTGGGHGPAGYAAGGGERGAAPLDLAGLHPRRPLCYLPWRRTGTLVEVDTRKNRARLDFNGVSLWAGALDLALVDTGASGAAPEKSRNAAKGAPPGLRQDGGTSAGLPGGSPLPLRLDLRGLRAEEALGELQRGLDRAILSGRECMEVVHGRGTGVLRREIHAFLKDFPAARSYYTAPEDQGGDGMTVVELA
jgi:DNA mismatch repair protein MutS2